MQPPPGRPASFNLVAPSPLRPRLHRGMVDMTAPQPVLGLPLSDGSNRVNTDQDDGLAELNYVEEMLRAQQRPGIRDCLKGLSRTHKERILACIRHAMHTRGEAMHYAERVKTESQRTVSDLETKRSLAVRLEERVGKKQRDIAILQQELKEANQLCAKSNKKAKHYEHQMTKAGNTLTQLQTQFHHDQKRKEMELQKLRTRVNQLLSDRTKQAKIGMRLCNPLKMDPLLQREWSGDAGEVQRMYYHFMDTHSTKCADLLEENEALRDSLGVVSQGMNDLLVKVAGYEKSEDDDDELDLVNLMGKPEYFEMPFDVVRDSVEATIVQQTEMIGNCVAGLINAVHGATTARVEGAAAGDGDREEHFSSAMESMASVLDAPACGPDPGLGLDDSFIAAERESLEMERSHLTHQQRRVVEEREMLNVEKEQMAHAKRELAELKKQLEVDKMLLTNQTNMLSHLDSVSKSIHSNDLGASKMLASTPGSSTKTGRYAKWANRTAADAALTLSPRVGRLRNERDLTDSAENLISFLNIDRKAKDQVKSKLFE